MLRIEERGNKGIAEIQISELIGRARLLPSRCVIRCSMFTQLSRSFALPDYKCSDHMPYLWA